VGGHTETYHDPSTGTTIDIGVVVWHDLSIVRDYFARFNVSLKKSGAGGVTTTSKFVDFGTGQAVEFVQPNFTEGLQRYTEQLLKYPFVEEGFDLPYPVPEDLLLPFDQFIVKYSIQDFVNFLFGFAQGLGDLLAQSTLYVFKNFGADLIRDLSIGFLTTSNNNNHELYEKALTHLQPDVLLSAQIVTLSRDVPGPYGYAIVHTPTGLKLIRAKEFLITIPPKLDNLKGFDLNSTEREIFSKISNSGYYTGLLRSAGLPSNTSFINAGPTNLFNIPTLPGAYNIAPADPRTPNLWSVKYGSATALSDAQVQHDILQSVERLGGANDTTFAIYSSHTPFELVVSREQIAAGFYKELYSLQGVRRTWWSGAAFHTHDSSLLWQFTEGIVQRMVG